MAQKKRRIRSPHPGVVLKERTLPSGKKSWRARFRDPDTGREMYVTLDPVELSTREARGLWAVRKSKAIAKRRMDLEAGAPLIDGRPIDEAVADYLKGAKHRLRARTITTYELGIRRFVAWAAKEGLESTAELSAPRLAAFRDHLIALPRQAPKKAGARGQRVSTKKKRGPNSVNAELRAIKTLLNAWRELGRLPSVTSDAIASALRPLPVERELPEFLTAAKLRALLNAAQRHDATTYELTRAEHAQGLRKGNSRRYDAIAPFVAFTLLTGCRRGEALTLRWADVDLTALDAQGRTVGDIRMRAERTKTKHARTIGLDMSPALRTMLAAMKLRAGEAAEYVFGNTTPYTKDLVEATRRRLIAEYGAPSFDWQALRSTCGTFLTNAPGIFGGSSAFMSAKQLGHSVEVAERHYWGLHRGVPADAKTLEAAMQIEAELRAVTAAIEGAKSKPSGTTRTLRSA